ncbi:SDR family oxidoreductase [Mesorhizobium sp. M4B.F.Ca.ET.214.01.1.1]|nr:MAG: SDR family oxidoreductase [Mesorhizobium sp.]TGQ37973.1 SDR family oxidoreductase [Mesorhizobium sp. M4B.F.Ca.ET.214.01.1.1]TGQ59739.1 SDR family oxidoreductase [Mesorhizobium sp. M4B.F.Ca.ET.211.01.1.1]TGU34805.1 SDR family oxidoreductase [Mesorhizobium sp. M4B.F.Ca.ET.150.01.1.1]
MRSRRRRHPCQQCGHCPYRTKHELSAEGLGCLICRIINISSINGFANVPTRLAYNAAKAAVISMIKVLAIEWAGYSIRVSGSRHD